MKPLLLLLLIPLGCFGQTDNYNYELENGGVYWRKVFERPGFSADSLRTLVKRQLLRKGMNITNEAGGVLQGRFEKYLIYNQNATSTTFGTFEMAANVIVEFKDDKYRAELSEINTFFSNNLSYQSRPMLMAEVNEVTKGGKSFRTGSIARNYMEKRNIEYLKIFEIQQTTKKDW